MEIISKKTLESEIVKVERGNIFTNSLKYSEEFGFNHPDVLDKIRKLTATYVGVRKDFIESIFINDRNRQYPYFEITRDGYMTLIMQMGSIRGKGNKKANFERNKLIFEKQQLFIKAFNKMEKNLAQQANTEWVASRNQGKIARIAETDVIKEFVEYATEQGSSNAKLYYMNITKATYKALAIIQESNPKTRDTLDVFQTSQLVVAESIVSSSIQKGMEDKEHYKDIYQLAKEALKNFAEVALIPKVEVCR